MLTPLLVGALVGVLAPQTTAQGGGVAGQEVRWSLAEAPTLEVGREGGEIRFERVVSAARLGNGSLMVADGGALEVNLISDQGRLQWTAGGEGQGPGEFTLIVSASVCAGDSIVVHDPTRAGMTVYDPSGEFVTLRRLPERDGSSARVEEFGCNQDGASYAVRELDLPAPTGTAPLPRGRISVVLHRPDSAVSLGTFPDTEKYFDGSSVFDRPFGRRTTVALGSAVVYVGAAEAFEIDVFDLTGARIGTIRDSVPSLPMSAERIEHYVDGRVESVGGVFDEAETREYYRDFEFPVSLPAYRSLRVDPDDNV